MAVRTLGQSPARTHGSRCQVGRASVSRRASDVVERPLTERRRGGVSTKSAQPRCSKKSASQKVDGHVPNALGKRQTATRMAANRSARGADEEAIPSSECFVIDPIASSKGGVGYRPHHDSHAPFFPWHDRVDGRRARRGGCPSSLPTGPGDRESDWLCATVAILGRRLLCGILPCRGRRRDSGSAKSVAEWST